jgi:Domain of unknown function (DUF4386)
MKRSGVLPTSPPPQVCARIGGVLYLIIIAAGVFAEVFVRDRLIVPGDAAATAGNIVGHQMMFRLGIAADLTTFVCAIPLTMILYVLLRRVSQNAALLMVMFNLVQDAIGGLNALNTYKPLQLLRGANYLKVFTAEQLQAMALLSLRAQSIGFGIALIFFGFSCIALGYLVFRCGFLPPALGVLMAIAGGCYLINSAALILSPRLASMLFPAILVPAFVGELSLAAWLTVRGVKLSKSRATGVRVVA